MGRANSASNRLVAPLSGGGSSTTGTMAESFLRDGYVWVRQAFSNLDAAAVAGRIWDALELRTSIRQDDAPTWVAADLQSADAQTALKRVGRGEAVAEVGSSRVIHALDEVMGPGEWKHPHDWGSILMTFPERGDWTVPASGWHIDMAVNPDGSTTCVRLFGFVLPARPRGGGTAIVAGSHRLTARLASECGDGHAKTLRRAMKAHPWVGRLLTGVGTPAERIEEFMEVGWNDGLDNLRVVELTGEPGDVILWHPGTLHAACPNVNDSPRLMVTATIQAGTRSR